MERESGLVCARILAAEGGSELKTWAEVRAWTPGHGALWVHLDRSAAQVRSWLLEESTLDPLICEAMLADETRPRVHRERNGSLLILRGVNLNPGADPEDMVSIRIWIEADRVISLRQRRLLAVQDVRERFARNEGPSSPGELVAVIVRGLSDRIGPVVDGLEEALDDLESRLIDAPDQEIRAQLSATRRQAVALRRYLAPQRDVLWRLATEQLPAFSDRDRARCREVADRMLRHVEDLDAMRERAAVTQEELVARLQDRLNRNMYLLSLVAAVFLPLGLITGLLGINVGGMPGADSATAFWVVCALLVGLGFLELGLLYMRRWF